MTWYEFLSNVSIGDQFILEQGNAMFFSSIQEPIIIAVYQIDIDRVEFKVPNRNYWQIMDRIVYNNIRLTPLSSTGKLLYNVE